MSQSLASQPPITSVRALVARVWDDPDGRSSLVGALGVIIFYLLLWFIAPHILRFEQLASTGQKPAAARQFNIEIAPDTFVRPAPKPPPPPNKFVETIPDAPENTPDKTQNFSDRNQQVAQEKPTPDGKSDRPALEGKKDFESTQIVSGSLTQPIERVDITPPSASQATTAVTTPKAEQNPLPGIEKKQGEDKDGFGSNIAKIADNPRAIPERIEGVKNAPIVEDATANQPAIDPQHPRARPQIVKQQQVRPAIFAENKFGTSNIGNIAVDAKWSNYGAYLQRMIDTVQIQWERILSESKIYPAPGSTVTVKFVMDDEGKIARIVNVDTTASESASHACVSGITDRAPYGPWTDDMKAVLGDHQEMTFTFYYQ